MSFNDIFKNSFMERNVEFSILDTLISLVLAYALGKVKEKHVIDQDKCIKCGVCLSNCKFKAIEKK